MIENTPALLLMFEKSFFTSLCIGIVQLHDQLAAQVNSNGIIKGILQEVQLRPFCTIAFMEASIRLYDALIASPHTVLSWDATGGIIKNKQSSKQILYYELTLAHPNVVNEDTLIPLTFMLSESHSLFSVVQWLTLFKESYKKVSASYLSFCQFQRKSSYSAQSHRRMVTGDR